MKKKVLSKCTESEMLIQEVYEDFQMENKVKNLSEMTLLFYEQNLKYFKEYLERAGIEYLGDIEKKHVDKFILKLKDKGLKDNTINTYLRATRSFLYFAMRENYLSEFKIRLINSDKQQIEPYSKEEIQKLIKKPNLKECGFVEHRNWVLVNYLLETGNRLNTILNLKVNDIDMDNGMVVLTTTKNRQAQFNPISIGLVKILVRYIRFYELNGEDYLFVNELGKKMTRNSMQHAIARYNRKRGVNKTSIHAFRHTFAKHYVTSGGDAFKLQRLLGHSTLQVTLNYVKLYANDLKEGFERHSIVSSFEEGQRLQRGKRTKR
ncbi:tyrosine-type recombinase/integrase [Pseudalkalibacillus sp. A8]|uniref:tyrosine-type recombinase/integrase n=1 Tax=Pseudalkalibacillus sp. A8 TaxID=3382641 RepID=UPI0038B6A654